MELFLKNIIFSINKFANGKHTVFAKKAGIPPSTFQSYMKGNMPKPEHLIRISETYKINIDWLLTGEGEMIRKPEKEMEDKKDTTYIYKEEDTETAGLLSMTRDVLKSDTDYSASLAANIRSFHHAIKTENRLNGLEDEIQHIKKSLKQADRIRNNDQDNCRGEILKKRVM